MLWTVLCQLSGLFLFFFQISGTRVMGIIFLIIKSDIYQKKIQNWHVRNAASLTWKIDIPKGKKLSCTRSPRGSSSLWQNSQLAQTCPLSCIFHYGDLWSYMLCWFPYFFFYSFWRYLFWLVSSCEDHHCLKSLHHLLSSLLWRVFPGGGSVNKGI